MARLLLIILILVIVLKASNVTVVYFWQPGCLGCKYMEEIVFLDPKVKSFLSNINFEKVDVRVVQSIEGYIERIVVAQGVALTYINGTFKESGNLQMRILEVNNYGRIPIIGTPTIVVLEVVSGKRYIKGYLLGALPPDKFLLFLNASLTRTEIGKEAEDFLPIVLLFVVVLGVASAISPCVVLPLAVATSRRRLAYFSIGGFSGYVAWSAALTLFGSPIVLDRYLSTVLIILLGVMYLIGARVPYWRVQTFFHRVAKGSDFLAGLFMPFISLPCFIPLFGIAGVLSMALFASPMERFLTFFLFGATHTLVVSLISAILKLHKYHVYITPILIVMALLLLFI